MTIDSDKILHDLLNSLDSLEGIRPGEIPNIALYMDQAAPAAGQKEIFAGAHDASGFYLLL